MRIIICLAAWLGLTCPGAAQQIGNFAVDLGRDPAGRLGRVIALTMQGGGGMAIRCIDGVQSLAFTVEPSFVPPGTPVDVKLAIDATAPLLLGGTVLTSTGAATSFQTGGPDEVQRLARADQVVLTYRIEGAMASYLFRFRGIDQVVGAVQAACPVRPAS